MKRVGIILLIVLTGYVVALRADSRKLWVSIQYEQHGDRVLFIQDMETGTRCYAVTNDKTSFSGYAISCVPVRGHER